MFSNFVSQAHNYNEAYPVKKNDVDSSKRGYHSNNKYDDVEIIKRTTRRKIYKYI